MSGEQQGAQPWDPSLQAWWGWAGSAGGWALDMGHRVVQGPPNKACSPHGMGGKGPALGLLHIRLWGGQSTSWPPPILLPRYSMRCMETFNTHLLDTSLCIKPVQSWP